MKYFFLFLEVILALHISIRYKFFRNVLSFLLFVVISCQIISVLLTKSFIPEIAFSNIKSIFVIDFKYYFFGFLFIVFLFIVSKLVQKYNNLKTSNFCIVLLMLFVAFYPKSATRMFFKELYYSYKVNFGYKILSSDKNRLIKELYKEKIVYDSNVSDYIKPDKYNVILFFLEGISDIVISKDLTPNLFKIKQESIDVINYYNHTASTFRGIRGQILSSFQYSNTLFIENTGKWHEMIDNNKTNLIIHKNHYDKNFANTKYLTSFFDIAKKQGFNIYFQMAIAKYNIVRAEFMNMFKSVGVDEVFRGDKINAFTDKETFEFLFDEIQKIKQPFIYGVYNLGTHLGNSLASDGVGYKDGKNNRQNLYYNLDYYFGKFLDKFLQSPLSKNTVLIITSDHASYPEREFVDTFKNGSGYYVDKIPLIIYKKGITPSKIDVKNLNSLSLAPTICDILGITKAPNRFLGLSIFDRKEHPFYNKISAMGPYKYKVINGKVVDITDNEKFKKDIEKIDLLEKFGG